MGAGFQNRLKGDQGLDLSSLSLKDNGPIEELAGIEHHGGKVVDAAFRAFNAARPVIRSAEEFIGRHPVSTLLGGFAIGAAAKMVINKYRE